MHNKRETYMISENVSKKINVLSLTLIISVLYINSINQDKIVNITNSAAQLIVFLQQLISKCLLRFAVPLFYLISGFLFFNTIPKIRKKDWFARKILSRFFTLFIPFSIATLHYWIIIFVVRSNSFTSEHFHNTSLVIYNVATAFKYLLVEPLAYHLWFLRDLILLVIVTPVIYLSSKFKSTSILFVVISLCLWLFDTAIYFMSSESIFFIIGYFWRLYEMPVEFKGNSNKYIGISILYSGGFLHIFIFKICILYAYVLRKNNYTSCDFCSM